MRLSLAAAMFALVAWPLAAAAQEPPYFVTYSHYLEEPGNLEIGLANTAGAPRADNRAYAAPWLEIEYGCTGWWTTEVYLEGVTAGQDGGGFAGWRFENRFRPLSGEHRVNPVLYVEYESINEASRIQKEVVGSGPLDFAPIADLRQERSRELEGKLILSSTFGGWNLAENVIVEKNLSRDEGLEFGYAIGVSRSLGSMAGEKACRFCRETFTVGAEVYGGLGSTLGASLADTRHFVAPVVGWHVTGRSTLKVSPAFGLTQASDRYLLRVAWAYEMPVRGGER